MAKKKEKKAKIVEWLEEKLSRANIVIATDYRGLSVSEMTELRQKFREQGIEYRVVKNSLANFAGIRAGRPHLSEFLKGPTALVFGYGDIVQPAKVLAEYKDSSSTSLTIKGGILPTRTLTVEEIFALAKTPPKDELIAKAVGIIRAPLYRLIFTLNANLQGLVNVLQGRLKQLEGG